MKLELDELVTLLKIAWAVHDANTYAGLLFHVRHSLGRRTGHTRTHAQTYTQTYIHTRTPRHTHRHKHTRRHTHRDLAHVTKAELAISLVALKVSWSGVVGVGLDGRHWGRVCMEAHFEDGILWATVR